VAPSAGSDWIERRTCARKTGARLNISDFSHGVHGISCSYKKNGLLYSGFLSYYVLFTVMTTNSNEKDGSLQSSVAAPVTRVPGAARELDERRRAALSQVDNAAFS
jgi:hypothetical protein